MSSASAFRALVSGKQRGWRAALLRGALGAVEVPYALAVRWRNRRYDRGRAAVQRVGVPVISVGNITLGGTGKTPMVEWIARWLHDRGVRVTIVSRGYGAEQGALNDEGLELEQRLPDVPHLQNPNRVEAALAAIEELECQAIVLDDGFQHRRLARDLDLVLLDALEPLGYGRVFPRGLLREPLSGLARAHAIVLSRADLAAPAERGRLRALAASYAPQAVWLEAVHAPRRLQNATGTSQAIESLHGLRVAAFCGLGNPAGFRHTLEQLGYTVVAFREFPDHHVYERADVASLVAWAGTLDVAAVVTTHKDLVKIGIDTLGPKPLWALWIGLEFVSGQERLEQILRSLLPSQESSSSSEGQ